VVLKGELIFLEFAEHLFNCLKLLLADECPEKIIFVQMVDEIFEIEVTGFWGEFRVAL